MSWKHVASFAFICGIISRGWAQSDYVDDNMSGYPPARNQYNDQYRTYSSPAGASGPSGGPGPGPIGAGGPGPGGFGPGGVGPGPIGPGPVGPGPIGPGPIGPGPIGPGPIGPGPIGPGLIGPGPFGPGPIGPPFPPFGPGFGPFGIPPFFAPYGGLTPWCAHLEAFRSKLFRIAEPVIVAGISILIVWFLKQVLLPHFSIFTTAFRSRRQDVDSMTTRILNAVESSVCLDRIACNLGASASKYRVTKPVVKLLDKTLLKSYNPLVKIFKFAATQEDVNCEEFTCTETLKEEVKQDDKTNEKLE